MQLIQFNIYIVRVGAPKITKFVAYLL